MSSRGDRRPNQPDQGDKGTSPQLTGQDRKQKLDRHHRKAKQDKERAKIARQGEEYGLKGFLKTSRELVQETAPLYKKYWIDREYGEDQAERNAKAAQEVLPQVQSQLKESKANVGVFWAAFGALRTNNDRMQGSMGKELQASNPRIAELALEEFGSFKESKLPPQFLANFEKERKNYSLEVAFQLALAQEQERQRESEAANNQSQDQEKKKKPPKKKKKPPEDRSVPPWY